MSSRFRLASAALLLSAAVLLMVVLVGCEREERSTGGPPEASPQVTTTDLYAGQPSPHTPDPRAQEYEGNAFHIAQGQRYYTWYNCAGCHANGGGGMGPALMDDQWRYGGEIEQIHSTIVQGRPNGMPSFREKIPEQQVWQIAAYVRSLSGQTPGDATSSRADAMASTPPLNQIHPKPPSPSDSAAVQVPAQ